jgi:O-antigen ligase
MSATATAAPLTAPPTISYIDTPLRRFGVAMLCLFLFFAYARILDLKAAGLHIPLIVSLFALFGAALSGGIPRAISSRSGILLTVMTLWMVLCIPFAYWRSNSIELVRLVWSKSYLLFLLVGALLATVKEVRRAMNALAYGTVVVSALALYFRQTVRGRITIPGTALTNSNDIGQVLLMCVPFVAIMTVRGNSIFHRVFGFIALPAVFMVILKTGSRGVLIAIALSGLMLFWQSPMTGKIKLVVLGMLGIMVFVFALPSNVRSRYLTLFAGTQISSIDDVNDESAVASAHERKALMLQALRITISHPLFGVGPANFQSYAALDSGQNRQRARWRVTHNSYLQLSSEIGFPGVALFLGVLFYCFRNLSRVAAAAKGRPEALSIYHMAFALRYSLIAYSITAFFSSTAYEILFPTLAGLSQALTFAAKDALPSMTVVSAPAQLAPTARKRALAVPGFRGGQPQPRPAQ